MATEVGRIGGRRTRSDRAARAGVRLASTAAAGALLAGVAALHLRGEVAHPDLAVVERVALSAADFGSEWVPTVFDVGARPHGAPAIDVARCLGADGRAFNATATAHTAFESPHGTIWSVVTAWEGAPPLPPGTRACLERLVGSGRLAGDRGRMIHGDVEARAEPGAWRVHVHVDPARSTPTWHHTDVFVAAGDRLLAVVGFAHPDQGFTAAAREPVMTAVAARAASARSASAGDRAQPQSS
jgi:hypothetical protein